jgi:hypothetical protein
LSFGVSLRSFIPIEELVTRNLKKDLSGPTGPFEMTIWKQPCEMTIWKQPCEMKNKVPLEMTRKVAFEMT